MSNVAYTFLFGDYDYLKSPNIITPGWDYVCFTDNPFLRSDVWDVRLSPRYESDSQLETKKFAMKHMIMFHRFLDGYDLSLSLGAQMTINCDLNDFIAGYFPAEDDLLICRHDERNCIYDEAEKCKWWALDEPGRIDLHIARYREMGYPANNGLYATGIIARRHDRMNVRQMCELWWDEYRCGSRRDQLSLNFSIWKSEPIRIAALDYTEQFVSKRNFIVAQHKRRVRFDGTEMVEVPANTELAYNSQSTLSVEGKRYSGYLDHLSCDTIVGWAADLKNPNSPIEVGFYDSNRLLLTVLANQPRPDVGEVIGDNGLHGFTVYTPIVLRDGNPHTVDIRFGESGTVQLQIKDFVLMKPQ